MMIAQSEGQAARLLADLTDSHISPAERAAAARALALEGDPRPGVGVRPGGVPDIAWVRIPAGVCCADTARALPAFDIARYPVTVAQFAAFCAAPDGFRCRTWWDGLPARDYVPVQDLPEHANQPAERVSWCAAVAFTRWLSARTGAHIRLPTEIEWEQAARSPDGRRYPWGMMFASGCANLNETAQRSGPHFLERVVAVGLYPAGASAHGVEDLIGNVWEWCLNPFYDPDGGDPDDLGSDAERALRGGSWSCAADVCTTTRELDLPEYGYDGVGFRVVRVAG